MQALVLAPVLAGVAAPLAAQPDVLLEKRTNGQDADAPPGPVLTAGVAVTWEYVVTAPTRDLFNVAVTDDQGVVVTCPSPTVLAGESMTCTGNGIAALGQYANIGTVDAELQNGTPVSASDPSHYLGEAAPAVSLEKRTNGVDADTAPGPVVPAGSAVSWTYEVTNIGPDPLTDIDVTDDQGVTVTCPATTLAAGESMTCTANGIAQPGQYSNLGTVRASLPDESATAATDPSHYFGQVLLLEKATNGVDADLPPGPAIPVGDPVTWSYEVTNPGPDPLTAVAVTDDQGVAVSCPQTSLAAGESVTCTGNGIAALGQYANVGTATARLTSQAEVTANDPSHYFGSGLVLEKRTNGQDADLPPGPGIAVGAPVNWTYEVTNLFDEPLDDVEVTDDQGVTVTCPGTTLAAGASMTCTAGGVAQIGQYTNLGAVTATLVAGQVGASDRSHYFGLLHDFGDAPDPTFPTLLASSGASHRLGSGVFLGGCVDAEPDGQPTAASAGDDIATGSPVFGTCAVAGDDEDGVAFPGAPLTPGDATASVEVTANEACTLSAWIDFDGDGDWNDPGEDLFPGGLALAAGTSSPTFAVPVEAVAGTRAARFRCTSVGAVAPTGEAPDGEVEDHAVTLAAPAMSATKTAALAVDVTGNGTVEPGDTLAYTVTLVNGGDAAATSVVFTDTPDPETTLVVGSVTTTQGTVTSGNGPGNTAVAVDVGTIAAGGGTVTITFRVTVDPQPPGSVENQGTVSGANFPSLPTDDPGEPGPDDSTVTAVGQLAIAEIPAIGGWGLLAFALGLAALGARRLLAG